ncbi:MAG: hypothetical protein ACTSR3_22295 [Candidatus Helarchaeota archaeon]
MPFTANDYMDPDVAYLYGLIISRGTFHQSGDSRILSIDLEFTNLQAQGRDRVIEVRDAIRLGVYGIQNRLGEILGEEVRFLEQEHSIIIKILFPKNSMAWRALRDITNHEQTFRNFIIPEYFFEFDNTIHQEFMRGIADGCGFIRPSNNYMGRHRVYLQINNSNWVIPIQLCKLLQEHLGVPVQTIQWGHPNTREPNRTDAEPTNSTWAREHQIKIYVEDFQNVGFCFEYKQEILEELVRENEMSHYPQQKPCNPKVKRVRRIKPSHPCENHELLPQGLRGRHFNAYFEICQQMGCQQGEPNPQGQFEFAEDEEESQSGESE